MNWKHLAQEFKSSVSSSVSQRIDNMHNWVSLRYSQIELHAKSDFHEEKRAIPEDPFLG